jgi:hypothetical protein
MESDAGVHLQYTCAAAAAALMSYTFHVSTHPTLGNNANARIKANETDAEKHKISSAPRA